MKLNTTTLILGVAMAVVAGLFSSTIFGLIGTNNAQTSASASGLITGHVTSTVTDAAGNVKEYRQSDNLIVNQGENCVSKMLFSGGGASGTGVCTGANDVGYRFIQIGNGSAGPASDDYKLYNSHNSTSFPGTAGAGLLIRSASTVTTTNSSGNGAGTFATALLSASFTNDATNSQTVSESGLFNSTDHQSNSMFARQTFNAITLNNGDSLTVQWTVNIGGAGESSTVLTP